MLDNSTFALGKEFRIIMYLLPLSVIQTAPGLRTKVHPRSSKNAAPQQNTVRHWLVMRDPQTISA